MGKGTHKAPLLLFPQAFVRIAGISRSHRGTIVGVRVGG